jgi:hypothetical protein
MMEDAIPGDEAVPGLGEGGRLGNQTGTGPTPQPHLPCPLVLQIPLHAARPFFATEAEVRRPGMTGFGAGPGLNPRALDG